jgi:hypothetical protein
MIAKQITDEIVKIVYFGAKYITNVVTEKN